MRIAQGVNAMRASGIRIACCNRKLLIRRRINNLDIRVSIYVNACCLAAGLLSAQSQPLTGHFDSHRAGQGCRFTCIECARKFVITNIRFCDRNMRHAAFIQLTTQADIFRLGNCTCFIIGLFLFRRIGIESLPCLLGTCISGGESDGFRSQAGRRCCQAFCDLDRSAKISICVAGIVEFSCERIQRTADEVLLICFGRIEIQTSTIGKKGDLTAFVCLGNLHISAKDSITAVGICRFCCVMFVDIGAAAAIVLDGDGASLCICHIDDATVSCHLLQAACSTVVPSASKGEAGIVSCTTSRPCAVFPDGNSVSPVSNGIPCPVCLICQ